VPREKPPIVPLSALEIGQIADCFALLVERKPGHTSAGKPFFACRFRDADRTVAYMVWADGPHFEACENHWQPGRCYKLRVCYAEHEKYGPQVAVQQIREVTDDDKADGYDPINFVAKSSRDPDELFAELRSLAETEIADEPLRNLVILILDRNADRLRWLPGSNGKYYPFAGGWLEHTLSVAHSCLHLADKYRAMHSELTPPINRDLVLAGALLHDIGRVAELDNPLSVQSTVSGELIGHLILGRDIVREAAREVPDLNAELLQLLEHLILTHLNLPAWGSPRLPMIPECLILHHADDLDAKVEMYVRCLTRDATPGPFTERDPVLGKPLLKGRSV
jgi:3'-5' exoribonuclease